MAEKPSRQIDTPIKLCYNCDSKAIIIINKKYYCADCGLRKTTTRKEYENIHAGVRPVFAGAGGAGAHHQRAELRAAAGRQAHGAAPRGGAPGGRPRDPLVGGAPREAGDATRKDASVGKGLSRI